MRPKPLVLATILCLGFSASVAQQYPSRSERELFNAVNRERQERGLSTLRWSPTLALAAHRHAWIMVEHGTISHQFPGEPSLPARVTAAGATFMALAENVAEAPNAAEIHSLWMQSPGHRANILDPDLDSIGVAVAERGGEYYAVEDFSKAKTTTANLTR